MAFWIYQRRLRHFRRDGATYFVTWRVDRGQPAMDAVDRDTVIRAIRHFDGQRYHLHAFVVMDDHVHLVVTPAAGYLLHDLVRSWKSFSARSIHERSGHRGRFWQPEYCDRLISSDQEYRVVLEYIIGNPIRRWPEAASYPWLWVEGME